MLRRTSLTLSGIVSLLFAVASPLAAQDDNEQLERRLDEMERLLRVLRVQLAEQAGGKVAPSTGALVE